MNNPNFGRLLGNYDDMRARIRTHYNLDWVDSQFDGHWEETKGQDELVLKKEIVINDKRYVVVVGEVGRKISGELICPESSRIKKSKIYEAIDLADRLSSATKNP